MLRSQIQDAHRLVAQNQEAKVADAFPQVRGFQAIYSKEDGGKRDRIDMRVAVAISEKGLAKEIIEIKEGDDLIKATVDYNSARKNLVLELKKEGIQDDAKIAEILDAIYEPVRAADTIYDAVNQAMVDFPLLGKIFGNERMNVYIGEREPFNIVTQNEKVESLNPGKAENPTMNVYADAKTIDQLIAGEITPLDALQQGKIRYTGVGVFKSVKVRVLNFIAGALRKYAPGAAHWGK